MNLVAVILSSVGLALGSVVAGAAICFALWWIGRCLEHPAWGLPLAVVLVPVAVVLPASSFLDMTAVFAVMFSAVLWLSLRQRDSRHAARTLR